MTNEELLDKAPKDSIIAKSIMVTNKKLKEYQKILCSVSGGSDSDIMVDLCAKCDSEGKITYVFFDTGLEFTATKEHLRYLEQKYNIEIKKIKAIKPVPVCCKTYGQPFLSKQVSEWIERLQRHNFKWEDEPFDVLIKRYPNCRAALRWWCNDFERKEKESSFNIAFNMYLKEFMIKNPPQFKISNKCCNYAKKLVAKHYKENEKFDLNIYGVRKAEGGARKNAYKTCFSLGDNGIDEYRPIFWYLSDTKKLYKEHYKINYSNCYKEYGLKRTGCAGCPYSKKFEEELNAMEKFEPHLYRAVNNIFKESYLYTREYRKFVCKKRREGGITNE